MNSPFQTQAEKKALPTAADDDSIIDGLLAKLTAAKGSLPAGYKLSPIQVRIVCVSVAKLSTGLGVY